MFLDSKNKVLLDSKVVTSFPSFALIAEAFPILPYLYHVNLKVTRHLCFKNSKNLQPQDILAFNSANKHFLHLWTLVQKWGRVCPLTGSWDRTEKITGNWDLIPTLTGNWDKAVNWELRFAVKNSWELGFTLVELTWMSCLYYCV